METPRQVGFTECLAQILGYFRLHCRLEKSRRLSCVHCGADILRIRAYMSLHDEQFGDLCVGPGRAWRMEIPYCSACEDTPDGYGCIHMSQADLNLPSVVEASRPFGSQHPECRKRINL